jgi:hypothetical protein
MTKYRVTVQGKSWTFVDARAMSDIVSHFRDRVFVPGVEFSVEAV